MAGPYNGLQIPWQQPSRYGRNESGNYESWVFEGNARAIAGLAARYALVPGLLYDVQQGFGKWRLEVVFPWNADGLVDPRTDTIIRWELFAAHEQKYLLNAADNAGLVATLSSQQKEVIRQKLLTPPSGTTVKADFQNLTDPDTGNADNALLIYNIMASGQTSYLMEAPILRRTITTNLQYNIDYSVTYAKKLLKTDTLTSFEQVPGSLLFSLYSLVGSDISSDPNLAYGWYKQFPAVQQIAFCKWQIIQEWQYGWWTKPYGTPI